MAKISTNALPYTPLPPSGSTASKASTPAATPACEPATQSCEPAPSNVCLPPKASKDPQICSLFPEEAPAKATPPKGPKPTDKHSEKAKDHHAPPTVAGVLAHDVSVNVAHHAAEHGVHHLAHRAATRAAARAAQSGATRAVEHGTVRAAEHGAVRAAEHAAGAAIAHGAGEAAVHGLGRVASVAAPGLGAAAAGYLAYKGVEHSIEAGKRGNVGASVAFALAATVDGTTALVNGAGAVTGAGTLISTPVSIGLGAVATGISALGVYLDN